MVLLLSFPQVIAQPNPVDVANGGNHGLDGGFGGGRVGEIEKINGGYGGANGRRGGRIENINGGYGGANGRRGGGTGGW